MTMYTIAKVSVATFHLRSTNQIKLPGETSAGCGEELDYQPNMLPRAEEHVEIGGHPRRRYPAPMRQPSPRGLKMCSLTRVPDHLKPVRFKPRRFSGSKSSENRGLAALLCFHHISASTPSCCAHQAIQENVPVHLWAKVEIKDGDNITYEGSSNQAVDHLISLGHERIGYIGYGSASGITDARLVGCFENHRKHNWSRPTPC